MMEFTQTEWKGYRRLDFVFEGRKACLVLPDDTLVDNSGYITVGVETPVKAGGVWRSGVSWSKIGGVWRKTEAIHKKVDGSWKQ